MSKLEQKTVKPKVESLSTVESNIPVKTETPPVKKNDDKPKTKNRNFYVYALEAITDSKNLSPVNYGWDKKHCADIRKLIKLIHDLERKDKILKGPKDDPWTLSLDTCQDESNHPIAEYLYGYFLSTENGLRTKLLNNITLEEEDNKKAPGQNEEKKTGFSLRFNDGMFLLGEYAANIAKQKNVVTYLNYFLNLFKDDGSIHTDIIELRLVHIIYQGFLDKFNIFERVNKIEIAIDLPMPNTDRHDAFSTLANDLEGSNVKQVTLILSKKDNSGLIPEKIKHFASDVAAAYHLEKGKISGQPIPGCQNEVSLKGINERFPRQLLIDNEGEVLVGKLYEVLENLNENRPKIF